MRLKEAEKQQLGQIESLYLSAFPAAERVPFALLQEKREEGSVRIFAVESDEGDFNGMAITMESEDMALLGYFAISSGRRGGGIGSAAFRLLKDLFADKRFFLEVESTSVESENAREREERKIFYYRNGMEESSLTVLLKGVEMDILTRSCRISYEDYRRFYISLFGDEIREKIQLIHE